MKKLILIRGIPGSGKTTFAKKLMQSDSFMPHLQHFEADMWFDRYNGGKFDPKKLKKAHEWCQKQTKDHLNMGFNVIVSNTFIKRWEVEKYHEIAEECGCFVEEMTMTGEYQNVHGVPDSKVQSMKENFEP